MKIKKYIFRGLSLLMLLCVFTTQVSALAVQESYVLSDSEDNDQPVFRQLTHETVMPHYDFSFGEFNAFFLLNSGIDYLFFSSKSSQPEANLSGPFNPYLEKLLEIHIAINAP